MPFSTSSPDAGTRSPSHCIHNRARLYHVHRKPLYHVIGEVTSRYRRRVPARLAVERLMLLDAVLTTPNLNWLSTASEKGAYLANLRAAAGAEAPQEMPAATASRTAPHFSATFPIGLEPNAARCSCTSRRSPTEAFRTFLQAHVALLRAAPTWTLRLVFPPPLDRVYDAYQTVIREELESPLHPATIGELKWYFTHRQQAAEGPVHPQTQGFLDVGAKVFGTPRFTEMYRRWLKHGNAVFEGPSSPVIAEALTDGRGRVECLVLPHTYRHLSPLVDHLRSTRDHVEKRVEEGERQGEHRSARPQPPPSTPSPMPERPFVGSDGARQGCPRYGTPAR